MGGTGRPPRPRARCAAATPGGGDWRTVSSSLLCRRRLLRTSSAASSPPTSFSPSRGADGCAGARVFAEGEPPPHALLVEPVEARVRLRRLLRRRLLFRHRAALTGATTGHAGARRPCRVTTYISLQRESREHSPSSLCISPPVSGRGTTSPAAWRSHASDQRVLPSRCEEGGRSGKGVPRVQVRTRVGGTS